MKRQNLIKIHLYLSAFFAPFLFLMAFSGTCYLLGIDGHVEKKQISYIMTSGQELSEENIAKHLKRIAPDYSYEYLRGRGGSYMTRPTTRTYYEIKKNEEGYEIYQASPDLIASLIEIHKGHGPTILRWFEKVLGFSLILILISGVWLALQTIRDKKITLILMGSGFIVLVLLFTLL